MQGLPLEAGYMETPRELAEGPFASRYRIERELGRGGMATVYLARDLRHDRPVAVKVLHRDLSAALGADRFLREIRITANLAHPNILPLIDSGLVGEETAAPLPFYVMPFVEGESLRDRLRREPRLQVEDAARIAAEVADALGYAHTHGIVHRDIKPENILLEAGHAIVADFGVARILDTKPGEGTTTGVVIGTPSYMSPEQVGGATPLDGRSDLYSLGCVLYEMLAGAPPFEGVTPRMVAAKQLRDSPRSLQTIRDDVPAALTRVVNTALAKNPEERFGTATAMREALVSAGAGHAPRRGRWGWIAAAAMAAVVVTLVVLNGRIRAPAPAQPPVPQVAVMFFEDLSPGRTLQHIADGLTADLIDVLSQVQGLGVVSRDGVQPFRGKSLPPDSVRELLHVTHLLGGTVDTAGDSLRVSVRLIGGAGGRQIASRNIARPTGDLFGLQRDLADDVGLFLRQALGREIQVAEARRGTSNARAWEMVQRAIGLREDAKRLLFQAGPGQALATLDRADSILAEAETLDPAGALMPIERARIAERRAVTSELAASFAPSLPGRSVRSPSAWRLEGVEHATRALRLHPGDPRALEQRGTLNFGRWRTGTGADDSLLATAERDLVAAVDQDSRQASAWNALSFLRISVGRFEEAGFAAEKALEADAFLSAAPEILNRLLYADLNQERYSEASRVCRDAQSRFPADPQLIDCELVVLGWSASRASDADTAWAINRRLSSPGVPDLGPIWSGQHRLLIGAILARAGLKDSARAVLRHEEAALTAFPANTTTLFAEANLYLLLGQQDDALTRVAAALRIAPQFRRLAARSPWFKPLRTDPRFQRLIGPAPPSAL
jgi:TolB-like protein